MKFRVTSWLCLLLIALFFGYLPLTAPRRVIFYNAEQTDANLYKSIVTNVDTIRCESDFRLRCRPRYQPPKNKTNKKSLGIKTTPTTTTPTTQNYWTKIKKEIYEKKK